MSTYKSNRNTAGFLALFLGGAGIHKFYLGRPIQGIIYILFFFFGLWIITGVIALFEAVYYFSYSHENWDKKYNPIKK